jgi:hypothetical protein
MQVLVQVTLDGSNFNFPKFSISQSEIPVPIFSSIQLSKFTHNLSNIRSLKVLDLLQFGSRDIIFIVFHSRSLKVIIHTFIEVPNYFLMDLPGS